mmetsp:Transcript_2409/g.6049  ORF Transcript_2409/g.6049 Transcript_2409/m.6049 type:complete len:294 (+) Transcript_2409:884-1765(+)
MPTRKAGLRITSVCAERLNSKRLLMAREATARAKREARMNQARPVDQRLPSLAAAPLSASSPVSTNKCLMLGWACDVKFRSRITSGAPATYSCICNAQYQVWKQHAVQCSAWLFKKRAMRHQLSGLVQDVQLPGSRKACSATTAKTAGANLCHFCQQKVRSSVARAVAVWKSLEAAEATPASPGCEVAGVACPLPPARRSERPVTTPEATRKHSTPRRSPCLMIECKPCRHQSLTKLMAPSVSGPPAANGVLKQWKHTTRSIAIARAPSKTSRLPIEDGRRAAAISLEASWPM